MYNLKSKCPTITMCIKLKKFASLFILFEMAKKKERERERASAFGTRYIVNCQLTRYRMHLFRCKSSETALPSHRIALNRPSIQHERVVAPANLLSIDSCMCISFFSCIIKLSKF